MDSVIPLGQKNTLVEYMILSGADNRPPMLDKDLYDSWKSQMELYMQNREHGRMILESVENGPLIWPTIEENGVTRTKKYAELVAKDLWERVQLLMQGTSLTKQERERVSTSIYSKSADDTTSLQHLSVFIQQSSASQQFPPSQYGSIHPSQHYSSTYQSQPQFTHSSIQSSYPYKSQMNHQTSSIPQIAYQSPQVSTQPMTESPLMDSGLAVLVFSPGDDLIACLNNVMAFLTIVASLSMVKKKEMLAEAQEAGQILDEEQLAFLVDLGVPDGQAVQTIIPNNAAF
ncbi:hypothetical protein Tco_1093009 [Tanacetum coccineum]|uniref:Integrase, catalytic region, zinc finger, CCHC-type, peptidase aspartic, catalytic n=1 Tax=Tanacetum coccineum TaxID=301880 RepID=A0ABQ5IBH9_9ASTR